MEKTKRSATAKRPELNLRSVERQKRRQGGKRKDPRETKRGGEESLPRVNNFPVESTSKNLPVESSSNNLPVESISKKDIGRELDRVIEELFEVESKQERRRKGEKLLLSLWQEDKNTSPSEENELEDIEALLGNNSEDFSNTNQDEDDNVPFYGFSTPDNARQTRLIELIKTFEKAFDKNITTIESLEEEDNLEEELGCKEEEWKPDLSLTGWRKTQKA